MTQSSVTKKPVGSMVLSIDGPSGVGKSTVSRNLARRLGLKYIDTGAMYRAFAISADDAGVDMENNAELVEFAATIKIDFSENGTKISVNGKDMTGEIRSPRADMLSSQMSAKTPVRDCLVRAQQRLGASGGVVMEGRDIGTVVFPDADVKIFLDAPDDVRAQRRHEQNTIEKNIESNIKVVAAEMKKRDHSDKTRSHSPLKAAGDAVCIDTSVLSIKGVEDAIVKIIEERFV